MKTPIRLFSIVLAFLSVTISPHARATCQDACLTNNNTVQGDDALISITSGTDNTAIGFETLFSNTTGIWNTANGSSALFNNTTGSANTAIGFQALFSNTTGANNTATGLDALLANTDGFQNTANGFEALEFNTTGSGNTASGVLALFNNTTGIFNTATGVDALFSNSAGYQNIASGNYALYSNTTGFDNTAIGTQALYSNTTGFDNTAIGAQAGLNTTGSSNTAVGEQALRNTTSGSGNIALGVNAGMNLNTGSYNIDIGNPGAANKSNEIRIGTNGIHTNTFVAGISGVTVANGVGVIIDGRGHLGTVVSSARFKDSITPMAKASEAILSLKPVTFRYKHDLDPDGIPQFGLVAEDVEKVNRDLVARDEQGKPYTVRYEAVNAMLLNEFLKEHRTVQKQQREIDALKAELKEQRSLIHKVSAQLELSKTVSQTIANNQ
jgi:hypothetical protein